MQTEKYQILEWDSQFFGLLTAKILPNKLTKRELESILLALNQKSAGLVYWNTDPADVETQKAAQLLGGTLLDNKVTYEAKLKQSFNFRLEYLSDIEEYLSEDTNQILECLAVQSGEFSRFKVDLQISNDQFEDLYKVWMRNSINKTIADIILISRLKGQICGVITLTKKRDYGEIGLIAVDSNSRGKGIGTKLICASQRYFFNQGCEKIRVVTQKANLAACAFYKKNGFDRVNCENVYHFWL